MNRGPPLSAADLDPSGVADRGPDGPKTGRGPGWAGDPGTRSARDREGERAPGDAGGPTGDREGERPRRDAEEQVGGDGGGREGDPGTRPARDREGERARQEAGGPTVDREGEWARRDVEEQVGGDGGGRAGAGDGGAWVPLGDMWVADVVGPAAAEVAAGPEGATR